MAKRMRFLTTCPGCGDKHLGVECKKPTILTPVTVQVRCDNCDSVTLMKVSLPRNRENRNQIKFTPIKIKVSHKLAEMVEQRKALEAIAKPTSPAPDATAPILEGQK